MLVVCEAKLFRYEDLQDFNVQVAQLRDEALLIHWTRSDWENIDGPMASFRIDGRIVAIGGLLPIWKGRAQAYLFICEDVGGRDLLRLIRSCRRHLITFAPQWPRIECYVLPTFLQAVRFAERLGFVKEGYLRRFDVDGVDSIIMARIT